jgi:hypothetical protein
MSDATAIDVVRCGAKTRKGGTCRHRAGERTTHVGQGKCWMHGGTKPGDPRLKTGRYSTITRVRLRELIAQHEADPDPLNILPEIAALRALFQEFVERYDEHTEALLAWHASFQLTRRPLPEDLLMSFEHVVDEWENVAREGAELSPQQEADLAQARKFVTVLRAGTDVTKPRTVLDLTDAYRVLGEIGRMVERVEKARAANAISRPELNRVIHQLGHTVDVSIPDGVIPPELTGAMIKQQIREGWLAVAV